MARFLIMTGGLGNQMFEYAMLLALRSRGYNIKMDISYYDFFQMHNGYELERVFGIKEEVINKQGIHMYWLRSLHRLRPRCLYKFDSFCFDESLLQHPLRYLFGYWQDEQYFVDIQDVVRNSFNFVGVDERNDEIAKEMLSCNSVSLHIRRGDYNEFGMTLIGKDYYKNAIQYIKERVDNPVFYIFSDDIEESKAIADEMHINYQLISHNRGNSSYKDMFLMSRCRHNIIANSSFSWWGAWLNNNSGKIVVAPQIWENKKSGFKPQVKTWKLL